MKKLMIKSISLVLVLLMSALMMFSCDRIWQGKDMNPEAGENKDEVEKAENDSIDLESENKEDTSASDNTTPDADDTNSNEEVSRPGTNFVGMFPQGWTGGYGQEGGHDVEYWWVETYDEVLSAIDKLKSHGSTFSESIVFDYSGDLFDVKYCFIIYPDSKGTERIEFGDDPFDRCAMDVIVQSWGFYEDVTIDEINYSFARLYKSFRISMYQSFIQNYIKGTTRIPDEIGFKESRSSSDGSLFYILYDMDTENNMFMIKSFADFNLNDEIAEVVMQSLVYLFFE